jgi:hypothetical protein
MRTALLCGLVLLRTMAAANLTRAVLYEAVAVPDARVPIYENGYLIVTYSAGDSAITVYGPDGVRLFDAVVKPPQAASLSLGNSAASREGGIAVAVEYSVTPQERAGGIAVFDRRGRQTRFIETGRYIPSEVAFDADRSLWALGRQLDAEHNSTADRQDYVIFRKFSPDGEPVGAYIPRSLFPAGLEPGSRALGEKSLSVADGRVGALVVSGGRSELQEWVELDLTGKLLGRWRMDHVFPSNLAFTPGGLYGHTPCQSGKPVQLTVFDRSAASWRTIPGDLDSGCLMLGADGEDVVFMQYKTSPILLKYLRPPPPG